MVEDVVSEDTPDMMPKTSSKDTNEDAF